MYKQWLVTAIIIGVLSKKNVLFYTCCQSKAQKEH